MSSLAIQLDKVTKKYRTGRSRTLGDLVASKVDALRGKSDEVHTASRGRISSTIWALRDVSLDIPVGAGLGVIGRNGAGKTTLLKLISRVTWPTSGAVRVGGHVVSLIELGAGFHPELTGRENVYLGAGPVRPDAERDRPAVRRHRPFRGRRAADRHADEALLVRSVRAARIRRRDLQPSRHRARRRSARRRRRRRSGAARSKRCGG